MATTLNAVLNIAAKTSGEGAVNGLAKAVGGLDNTSKGLTGGLRTLAGSAGGLGNALGMLAPALSVGGLVGLATNSIKGADALNDLAQKTGVSVEALARFKKAASVSGTDLESVSKALIKLSKGMNDAATTGKGPAAEAFKILGISVTDASGKLKSSDKVMIEVANRFKTMPDGAQKTAIALQLFGKAGADMIPMLNMGGEAIDKMSTKMTAAFAAKADEYSDKLAMLQGKIGGIGTSIAIALLPALDALASILAAVVDVFTKLPGPIQAIIGGFALLAIGLTALAPLFGIIAASITAISGLGLAATIAGWAGALVPLGSIILGIFTGPVGWAALLIAAAVALFAFRDKIGEFLGWLGGAFSEAFSALAALLTPALQAISAAFVTYVVEPIRAGWSALMAFFAPALDAIAAAIGAAWQAISRFFVTYVVEPIRAGWSALLNFLGTALNAVGTVITEIFKTYFAVFKFYVVDPIVAAWNGLMAFLGQALNSIGASIASAWQTISNLFTAYVVTPIRTAWNGLMAFLGQALNSIGASIASAWQTISNLFTAYVVTPIRTAWSALVSFLVQVVSNVAASIANAWQAISSGFDRYVTGPISQMWSGLMKLIQTVVNSAATGIGNAWISISNFFVKYVTTPISTAWSALTGFLSRTLSSVTTGISNIWNGMVTTVKNALRGMVQFAASALNGVINALNNVINGINVARRAMNQSTFGTMSLIQVPAFAEGGVVNRPTLLMAGEGGEREWIIPESKMARASANYLAGARGSAVLNGNGSGGVMPQINITTGPIMQTPDGQQWVSLADLERAQRQTVATVMGQLRTPAGRYAVGVR